jgi:hypothetical protein
MSYGVDSDVNEDELGKHALLFFASISPSNLSRSERKNRLVDYRTALLQINRLKPSNWTVVLCENTLEGSKSRLADVLEIDLSELLVSMPEKNFGEKNKGIGELDMMVQAIEEFPSIVSDSNSISYLSGRRLMPNEYLFHRASRLSKEALISNPDFVYLDGDFTEVEKRNMYNDMFFAMQPQVFAAYAKFFLREREKMINQGIGSEQNLYNFIHENNIDFEWINQLGLIRRERTKKFGLFPQDRIHIC